MKITITFNFLPHTPMMPGCNTLEASFKEALALASQGHAEGWKWIEDWVDVVE